MSLSNVNNHLSSDYNKVQMKMYTITDFSISIHSAVLYKPEKAPRLKWAPLLSRKGKSRVAVHVACLVARTLL